MLGKLIKYEFKASGRLIPLVYLVVGLLAIVGMILSLAKVYVYVAISFVLMFLAGAAAIIITYVIIFLRFYRGMFGAEGYLSMTLPVSPTQLYLSKTITSFVWLFLSSAVMVFSWASAFVSMLIMVYRSIDYSLESRQAVQELWREAMEELPQEFYDMVGRYLSPGMIVFFIIMGIIGYLSFTSQVYFCVTVSNVKPFQSLGIGSAIIAFVVLQIINGIINTTLQLYLPFGLTFDPYTGWSLINDSTWNSMFGYGSYYSSSFTIGLGSYLLPILYAFVLPIFTIRLIDRKVSLK